MTYFSLRKPDPEPEPEPVEVDEPADGAAAEAPAQGDKTPDEPTTWLGAIQAGLLGPGRWISARTSLQVAWAAHIVAIWACGYYGGWIAAGLIAGWLGLVLLFIPREFLERAAAAVERRFTPAPKPPKVPVPGGEREAVRRLLLDVLEDADKVHLNTVLAHLQKHGQWEGKTVTDLRGRLAHLGIPHDRKVKVAGVPTWGVRRQDLDAPSPAAETAPSPAPSPPV